MKTKRSIRWLVKRAEESNQLAKYVTKCKNVKFDIRIEK